jgi:hypothetical protein
MVVANAGTNTISVLLGNGDGTFQAPRQFVVGAFKTPSPVTNGRFPTFRRDVAIKDLNGDGIPDVVVTNYDSGDVSVLLGRGDGTFEPQRRYNATAGPFALDIGDLTGSGIPDLAVVDATSTLALTVAVLLGRGDGTFLPERTFQIRFPSADNFPYSAIRVADLNGDGKEDLIISGATLHRVFVYLSNGDGTFRPVTDLADDQPGFPAGGLGAGLAVGDVNGDGKADIVNTALEVGAVDVLLGNGDGTFQPLENFNYAPTPHQDFAAGQAPLAVAIADVATFNADGSTTLGQPDGHPDLIVAASGVVLTLHSVGPPGVFVQPAIWSGNTFIGFDFTSHLLAGGEAPQDVKTGDLNGDGVPDVAVVDRAGVRVVFGKPPAIVPNDTPQTARSLGTVVHLLEPTLTVVPGHEDAYYTLTVPTEAVRGAADEVLDFSGLFQATEGAGLSMEVRDAAGNLLGSGERFRVAAPQAAVLTLHVFGVTGPDGSSGAGAYTLDVDTLPQLVSVEAQALLPGAGTDPGGPTNSLVLTFQGDRLDPAGAQDPANYTVTPLGPDRVPGTAHVPVVSVVYDPSTNVDVASGNRYPTAVRQTVTLVFGQPLPPGSYLVTISPAVHAAAFNGDEASLLASAVGLTGHAVVSVDSGRVSEGSHGSAQVLAPGPLGDFGAFEGGTPFLTQLHDDLGALLDAGLTQRSDDPAIPLAIDSQILDRFVPSLGPPGERPTAVLVIWLDPVSFSVADPNGQRAINDLQDNSFANGIRDAFVSVAGNVEVCVLPFLPAAGTRFLLDVAQVPPRARGGVLYIGPDSDQAMPLTTALRNGTTTFLLSFGLVPAPAPLGLPPPSAPSPLQPSAPGQPLPAASGQPPAPSSQGPESLLFAAVDLFTGTGSQGVPVISAAPPAHSAPPSVPTSVAGNTNTPLAPRVPNPGGSSVSPDPPPPPPIPPLPSNVEEIEEIRGRLLRFGAEILRRLWGLGPRPPADDNRADSAAPAPPDTPLLESREDEGGVPPRGGDGFLVPAAASPRQEARLPLAGALLVSALCQAMRGDSARARKARRPGHRRHPPPR